MARGRPTKKTPEIQNQICEAIETTNEGNIAICKKVGIGYTQFKKWLREDPEFAARYAHAKQEQAHIFFEEIISVAKRRDEDHTPFTGINVIQRDKLIIDSLKWVASKLHPKKYGDKLDIELNSNTIEVIIKE